MEGLKQTEAMLLRAKVNQALGGKVHEFVEVEPRLCKFPPDGWKVAVHIAPTNEAAKIIVGSLAELYDGNVCIYNPQLLDDERLAALFKQKAEAA